MSKYDEVEFFGGPMDGSQTKIPTTTAGAAIPVKHKVKVTQGLSFSLMEGPVHLYERNGTRMEYKGVKFSV